MRVREIIKDKGLTTKELATRMGISVSALNQHISGNPSLKVLEAIAFNLDVPLWRLFASAEDVTADASEAVCPHCGQPIEIEFKLNKPHREG